jgi:glycosyltransferase involved in cell wall biosynthesis
VRIYWYAPFNNADEREVATALADADDDVTFQTLAARRGTPTVPGDDRLRLVADLPDTPGDDGGPRTRRRRTRVTIDRVRRRHRALRGTRFDVVHLHTYNPFVDPVALRLMPKGAKSVLSIHNVLPHDRKLPSEALERRVLRAGYVVPDRLIVAHAFLVEQLVEDFRIDPDRISVVPLPIREIDPLPDPPPDLTSYLLFGTLRRNKGIEVALEAMRLLSDPDVRLHVAGQGDAEIELLVQRAARTDPRITAEIGYVPPDRQTELFATSSTLLLPYTGLAAQSGVLRDACAFRRPVIASDLGALGAQVRDADLGPLVTPCDAAQLADAMTALSRDQQRWQDHRKAIEGVARSRSIPAIAALLRSVYRDL